MSKTRKRNKGTLGRKGEGKGLKFAEDQHQRQKSRKKKKKPRREGEAKKNEMNSGKEKQDSLLSQKHNKKIPPPWLTRHCGTLWGLPTAAREVWGGADKGGGPWGKVIFGPGFAETCKWGDALAKAHREGKGKKKNSRTKVQKEKAQAQAPTR